MKRLRNLVVLLWLFQFSATAYAAPVVVAVALAAAEVITITQMVLTIGFYIYGAAQQKRAEKKARAAQEAQRAAYNASLKDRTVTSIASEAAHMYVYGRARVGSAIVAVFTSGSRDQYKHLVCVHAAHECDGLEKIWIAGKELAALDGNGDVSAAPFSTSSTNSISENFTGSSFTITHSPVTGSVTTYYEGAQVPCVVSGRNVTVTLPTLPEGVDPDAVQIRADYQYVTGTSYVNVKIHLGTPTDTADSYLMSVSGGLWASTALLRGFCYTVVTLNLDEPEFQGGIPSIEVLLRGKKIYDPRTDTIAWSENPALVVRDYLTGEICNVDAEDIPEDDLITAANVCDELIGSDKRYTFNGAVSSSEAQAQVLEKMAEAMAGGICSTSWEMYAGKYVAPVMALVQDDIVGDLAITPGLSDADIYNGVRGQFISPENGYVSTDFKPFQNAAYVTADNGRELWTNIDFPYTNTTQRVWNLARIFTEDQRNAFTVKAQFSLKAWRLRIGQRVTFTSEVFGFDEKVFRVTDRVFSPDSPVELTLKEDAPEIWDQADAVTPDSTPNTNLPDPFYVPKVESVTCQSGTDLLIAKDGTVISRIRVTWPLVQSQPVQANGLIEVEWRKVDTDVWNKAPVSGTETSTYISPAEDGAWYIVRVRPVNPYLNVKADWTYAEAHQVVGKTARPDNMQGLTINGAILSCLPNNELDRAGYIFRFHYGNNRDWGTAAPLHEGVLTSLPFDMVTRPSGVVTIMGKVLDTSGNESAQAAYIVTNLGDIPVANVVETFDFHADGFPGTITGGEVDLDGNLVADETDSFYGDDNQSAYGPDNEPAYLDSSYGQLVYVTNEIVLSPPLDGALMTLVIESQGIDLTIEFRRTGPGSAYGADSDSAYGPDAESFYGMPGEWQPWPGQIPAAYDGYQWRVTLGAGGTQGKITALSVIVDAPDMVEYIEDIAISATGTMVPYTKPFTVIKTVTPTLQAGVSDAVTVKVDKSSNLFPVLFAYDASLTAVAGASSDVIIKGY